MILKMKYSWKQFCDLRKLQKHQNLYDLLKDKGLMIDDKLDLHSGDNTFADGCDGFRLFLNKYGEKAAELLASELIEEIETVKPSAFGSILLVEAEYYFRLLSEQAERGIDTRDTERDLNDIKSDLAFLSECKDQGEVALLNADNIRRMNDKTKLKALETLQQRATEYISFVEGDYAVVNLKQHTKCYFIFHQQQRRLKKLRLTWTGKELVAVHIDALNEQAKKLVEKHLAITAESTAK